MNVAEILRGCPSDIRLYSPIYGELSLVSVCSHNSIYPILCRVLKSGNAVTYTEDGKNNISDAESTLFPSRDQRDWSKFEIPKTKTKSKPYQFKPFDRVLARNRDDEFWFCEHFGHIDSDGSFICAGKKYSQCIPYEGNEHLLRTIKKPEE